jgi:hypothetical protein
MMRQGVKFLAGACIAALVCSAAPAMAMAPEPFQSDKEATDLLIAQHKVVERRRQEWLVAFIAARSAAGKAEETAEALRRIQAMPASAKADLKVSGDRTQTAGRGTSQRRQSRA